MPEGVFAKPENSEKKPCAHRPMRPGSLSVPELLGSGSFFTLELHLIYLCAHLLPI